MKNYFLPVAMFFFIVSCSSETHTETHTKTTTTVTKEQDGSKNICDCVVEKQNDQLSEECEDMENLWMEKFEKADEETQNSMREEVNTCLQEARAKGLIIEKKDEEK
jgi:hypothetical protein